MLFSFMNSLFDFPPDIAIFISKLDIRELLDWRVIHSLADGRIFINFGWPNQKLGGSLEVPWEGNKLH